MDDTIAWNLQQGLFKRLEVRAIHLAIDRARRKFEPLGQWDDIDSGDRVTLGENVFDGTRSDGAGRACDADVQLGHVEGRCGADEVVWAGGGFVASCRDLHERLGRRRV
jgi:hypothetical protein